MEERKAGQLDLMQVPEKGSEETIRSGTTGGYPIGIVVDLLHSLMHNADFQIGVDQILRAECLLTSMAIRGWLPADTDRLKTLLAPLVCTTPAEQAAFYRLFDQHCSSAVMTEKPDKLSPQRGIVAAKRFYYFILLPAAMLLLATGLWMWSPTPVPSIIPITPPEVPINSGSNVETAPPSNVSVEVVVSKPSPNDPTEDTQRRVVETNLPTVPSRFWIVIWWALLPTICIVIWWSCRRLQLAYTDVVLARQTTDTPPSILGSVQVHAHADRLFADSHVSLVSRRARARSIVPSKIVDIEATLESTVRRAGVFTPRFKTRSISPEYLVLLERRSTPDHMAELVEAFLNRLALEEVKIDRYWYTVDPSLVTSHTGQYQWQLQRLLNVHGNARVVFCGHASSFFHRYTGRPCEYLSYLESRPLTTLLTYNPITEWSSSEVALTRLGFSVLPLSLAGIEEMGMRFSAGSSTPRLPINFAPRLSRWFEEHQAWWLSEMAPDNTTQAQLYDELSVFLGRKGMLWLAACAVYPEVNWHLTLYLGQNVVPDYFGLETIASISRLPWLRRGRFPDWLRSKLIDQLPAEQIEQVRFHLNQVLLMTLRGDSGPQSLKIAWKDRQWLSLQGDRALRQLQKQLPDDPTVHEHVFARLVRRSTVNSLIYHAPRQLREFLFPARSKQPILSMQRWRWPASKREWSRMIAGFLFICLGVPAGMALTYAYRVGTSFWEHTEALPTFNSVKSNLNSVELITQLARHAGNFNNLVTAGDLVVIDAKIKQFLLASGATDEKTGLAPERIVNGVFSIDSQELADARLAVVILLSGYQELGQKSGVMTRGGLFWLVPKPLSDSQDKTAASSPDLFVGYGSDLKYWFPLALADLQGERFAAFVVSTWPESELAYLIEREGFAHTVSALQSDADGVTSALKNDLAGIQQFIEDGGEPSYSENGKVATFVVERIDRRAKALSLRQPRLRSRNLAPSDARSEMVWFVRGSAEFDPKKSSQFVGYRVIEPTFIAQPPVIQQAEGKKNDIEEKPDPKEAAPNVPLQPPPPPIDRVTITCKLELVNNSWRFFDVASQVREAQQRLSILSNSGRK